MKDIKNFNSDDVGYIGSIGLFIAGSWFALLVILVCMWIGRSNDYTLVLFGFALLFFILRSFVWNYTYINSIELSKTVLIRYRIGFIEKEIEVDPKKISIEVSRTFSRGNKYKMKLRCDSKTLLTQYDVMEWSKDMFDELHSELSQRG